MNFCSCRFSFLFIWLRRMASSIMPLCQKKTAYNCTTRKKEPGAKMTVSIEEKKRIVSEFLQQCAVYADDKLVAYQQQAALAKGNDVLALQDKISHWTAYRVFTEYTVEELKTAELDSWFKE